MKTKLRVSILLAISVILIQSCGKGLQDPSKITANLSEVATGSTVLLDAKTITGTCPASLTWNDSSGNGNNGTINCTVGGSVSTTPSRVIFDGTNTTVSTALSATSTDMPEATWVAWVKPTASGFSHILSIDDHAGAFNRSLTLENSAGDKFGVFNRNPNGSWEATTASLNQWQFLVVEFTPTNIVLQKNGSRFTYGSAPNYNNNALTFTIGSSPALFDFFTGEIAWVAIYPRILTSTEIRQTCLALVNRFVGASCD